MHYKEFTVRTSKRRELVNITEHVEKIVRESGMRNGIALIFVPHATAAIIANEDEPLIREDYLWLFERIAPENFGYSHNRIDNNADSHMLSALFKQFYIFPIKEGELVRGRWQEIMLAEFDGPRTRRISVAVIGCDKGSQDSVH